MSCHPLDFRIACVSSQPGPGAGITGSHYSVRNTIGRHAVPTFFWGEAASPGRLQRIADRLILMGDWRDSDRSQINEETDAVVELEREQYFEYPYRISSENFVRTFDSGQLMGDPISCCILLNPEPPVPPIATRAAGSGPAGAGSEPLPAAQWAAPIDLFAPSRPSLV